MPRAKPTPKTPSTMVTPTHGSRDIRDKINDGAYKSKLPVRTKPREPRLPELAGKPSQTQFDALDKYKADLIAYESELELWKKENTAHAQDAGRLTAEFKDDLIEELGINFNPKRDLLFSKAWERGHGSGLHEVLNIAEDLVELIQ